MSKIQIYTTEKGKKETWTTTHNTERIGMIDWQVQCYSVVKLQGGYIYPVEAIVFKFEKSENPRELINALTKGIVKLKKVDSWTSKDYRAEVYLHPNPYAAKDTVKVLKDRLTQLGFVYDFGSWVAV